MPEKSRVVAGGMPVMMGTRKVAPNMATTCCMPMPMVRGHASRSSGATTWPGRMDLPLPWSFHLMPSMLMAGPSSEEYWDSVQHYRQMPTHMRRFSGEPA
ncbi:hypothetical protein D3C73_1268400 [compost metagenome]